DADRRLFTDRWWGDGRFDRLQREVWDSIPRLRELFAAWAAAERLLCRGPEETADAFRLRAASVLRELRRLPIFADVLRERLGMAGRPLARGRLLGKLSDLLARARRRVRREGYGGLFRALARRVGLLAPPQHPLGGRRGPVVSAPNPTLDAYQVTR